MSELNDDNYDITFPNGDVINANRWNTALYTFIGHSVIEGQEVELADYDHIFITRRHEEGEAANTIYGNYIWKSDEIFEEFRKKLRYLEWTQYLNVHYISDSDVQAFNRKHYGDLERDNAFPEAWVDKPEELGDERAA